MFNQKHKLGLISSYPEKRGTLNITLSYDNPELLLVLVNHDPAKSTMLSEIKAAIEDWSKKPESIYLDEIKVVQSSLVGHGLGPNTVAVIKTVLGSKKLEVQTYRTCVGILQYKDRYNGAVLEECCTRAMRANRPYYSYIKNTVAQVAEELKVSPVSKAREEKAVPRKGGITRAPKASELDTLLSKSKDLLGKGADA